MLNSYHQRIISDLMIFIRLDILFVIRYARNAVKVYKINIIDLICFECQHMST